MTFPRTIAYAETFCNRKVEKKRLHHNIENIQHTLVISPRRYGKTSLILKTIEEISWHYAYIDLFLALDERKIADRFLDGIAKLVTQIIPINMKAIAKIRDFFKLFTISVTAGDVQFGLKLESTAPHSTHTIKNALESLEALLKKHKKNAIIFIDEMQDMVQTPICSEMEAILRFYAQKSKNIAFIFSGSNRKLLKEIFDDRSRPLFKMCDRLNLQRIEQLHYEPFLNNAALKKWKKKLPEDSLQEIFLLTELHPYYLNYLCSNLWVYDKPPTLEEVKLTWKRMCEEEINSFANELDLLSANQKRLLDYIAHKGLLNNPSALEHQKEVSLTSRGILQSLKGLLENDILEKTVHGIRITDPMLKAVLLK